MRKIVFAALCAFAAVAVSCKNDRESDVNPGDSDIDGLYINSVFLQSRLGGALQCGE